MFGILKDAFDQSETIFPLKIIPPFQKGIMTTRLILNFSKSLTTHLGEFIFIYSTSLQHDCNRQPGCWFIFACYKSRSSL